MSDKTEISLFQYSLARGVQVPPAMIPPNGSFPLYLKNVARVVAPPCEKPPKKMPLAL